MATYFITETYLKENTPISQNVDIKDIVPNIAPAQDLHIQVIIEEQYGESFFSYLLNSYSGQTLNADEVELVSHIKPALAYKAAEISLPWVDSQIKNKGIQSQSGDFSAAVDANRMIYLRNELKNKAEAYTNKLIKYMVKNKALFAANIISTEVPADKSASNNNFDAGIIFYPNTDF